MTARVFIVKPMTVLTATVGEAIPVLSEAYPPPEFEYIAVLTLAGAISQLDQPYNLIACSVLQGYRIKTC
jgi:hypothetical protein